MLLGAACLTLLAFGQASAAPLASGTFTNDQGFFSYSFATSSAATFSFQTTSYAAGGFVPVLSLYNTINNAFIVGDGGDATCSAGMTKDATTGICNDAAISALLNPGSYILYLTEFDNYPGATLSVPFFEAGNGNFTDNYCAGATKPFQEIDLAPCVQRTGNFAVNLTTSPATVTPEPSTLLLVLPPALALFGHRRRRSA